MKFGYQQPSHRFDFPRVHGKTIFESINEVAQSCEQEGYDSFWLMDHLLQIALVGKIDEPIMESYTTLSALAAMTQKIKLGALCTCVIFRNPALLAKMGATIDQISNGRFWLGLGAGWYEEEARMYGYAFPNSATRLEMLKETLEIIKRAWEGRGATFKGKYFRIEDYVLNPMPVQTPRPKILVGGEGEKVTLKLAAEYADACNLFAQGEDLVRKLDALRDHCEKVGRNYTSILKTSLASVMFGSSQEDALRKVEKFKPPSLDLEEYARSFLLGTPSEIVAQIENLRHLGIEYLIVNFREGNGVENALKFSRHVMSSF